jgi:hypothetical protein
VSGLVHGGLRTIFLPPIEHALRDDTPYYRLPSTLLTKTRRLHGLVIRRPYRATGGPRSARARPWLLGRLLINQPIATTARVEAAKLTHLLARASPGRKSYSAVRSRQAAANRMILWPVPSTRAQPTRAEPPSVQSIKQPQLDLHSRLHNPAPIG